MKTTVLSRVAVCLVALSGPSGALTLEFPGPADATGTRAEVLTSYMMPIGPFTDGAVASRRVEGPLDQTAWRIARPGLTTLQLLQPLRDQVAKAGFNVIYECEAVTCGGFDFRYETEVLPEPEMHVDLGDYRYLAAERSTPDGPEYVSLIVSRSVDQGFVQVTLVGQSALPAPQLFASTKTPLPLGTPEPALPLVRTPDVPPVQTLLATPPSGALGDRLTTGGAQVLPDLVFPSGSATLSDGAFASLSELAAFLKASPQARVMLVGHTDASGGLEANMSLSRLRAKSVRQRLLTDFDIPPGQVDAQGVGFLSPRATNDTDQGRLANRRVEVMLLSPSAN